METENDTKTADDLSTRDDRGLPAPACSRRGGCYGVNRAICGLCEGVGYWEHADGFKEQCSFCCGSGEGDHWVKVCGRCGTLLGENSKAIASQSDCD